MPLKTKILLVDVTGQVLRNFEAVACLSARDTSEFYLTVKGKIVESVRLAPGQALIFSDSYEPPAPSPVDKDVKMLFSAK